jgi:hypothetical protein
MDPLERLLDGETDTDRLRAKLAPAFHSHVKSLSAG